jgi:hypothetical protein
MGAWGISGVAIIADITTKVVDAPPEKQMNTGIYHTLFHIPVRWLHSDRIVWHLKMLWDHNVVLVAGLRRTH